jgi:hypothetical protein
MRFDREGRVTGTVAKGPFATCSLTRREAIRRTALLGVAPLVVAACLPAAERPPPAAVAASDRGEPFADGSFFDDGFGWIA